MNDWQPIETAPKDGTLIIVYLEDNPDPYRLVKWYGKFFGQNAMSGWYDESIRAWMPLPEDPKKKHSCFVDGISVNRVENEMYTGTTFHVVDGSGLLLRALFCPFCGEKAWEINK